MTETVLTNLSFPLMGSSVVKAGSGFYHSIALIFKVRAREFGSRKR
jgi:hypothetical protein